MQLSPTVQVIFLDHSVTLCGKLLTTENEFGLKLSSGKVQINKGSILTKGTLGETSKLYRYGHKLVTDFWSATSMTSDSHTAGLLKVGDS